MQARIEELETQQEKIAADKVKLDSLAANLIAHARTYHPHMRHVLGIDGVKQREDDPPTKGLRDLLLHEMEQEDAVTQRVVLKHPEMRKVGPTTLDTVIVHQYLTIFLIPPQTVFTISYDRTCQTSVL